MQSEPWLTGGVLCLGFQTMYEGLVEGGNKHPVMSPELSFPPHTHFCPMCFLRPVSSGQLPCCLDSLRQRLVAVVWLEKGHLSFLVPLPPGDII